MSSLLHSFDDVIVESEDSAEASKAATRDALRRAELGVRSGSWFVRSLLRETRLRALCYTWKPKLGLNWCPINFQKKHAEACDSEAIQRVGVDLERKIPFKLQ